MPPQIGNKLKIGKKIGMLTKDWAGGGGSKGILEAKYCYILKGGKKKKMVKITVHLCHCQFTAMLRLMPIFSRVPTVQQLLFLLNL